MKAFKIIMLSIFAFSSVPGQSVVRESQSKLLELKGDVKSLETYVIENDSKILKEKYTFNQQGNYLTEFTANNSSEEGTWRPASNKKYVYDIKGNMVKFIDLYYSEVECYFYREDGALVEKIHRTRGGGYDYNLKYERDANGLLLQETRINSKGKQFVVFTYSYNKNKLMEQRVGEGTDGLIENYEYDERGNVIKKRERNIDFFYKYDAHNNKIEEKGVNANGSFRYKYSFHYDDNNNLVKNSDIDVNDKIMSEEIFIYNSSGKIAEVNYYSPSGRLGYKTINTYDQSGNLITTNYFEENFENARSTEDYTYDNNNNWIQKISTGNNSTCTENRVLSYYSEPSVQAGKQNYPVSQNIEILKSRTAPYNILDYYLLLPGDLDQKQAIVEKTEGETYIDPDGCNYTVSKINIRDGYFEISRYCQFEKRRFQYVYWQMSGGSVLIGVNEIVYIRDDFSYSNSYNFYVFDGHSLKLADVGILNAVDNTRLFEKLFGSGNSRLTDELAILLQLPEKGMDINLKIIDMEQSLLNNEGSAKEVILKWREGKFGL
jgi:hypothetical protein